MESGKIKIVKLEAARRQLETAIRLYFGDGDPVSIHTLAAASLEILKNLDKQGANTGTIFDDVKQVKCRKSLLGLSRDLPAQYLTLPCSFRQALSRFVSPQL